MKGSQQILLQQLKPDIVELGTLLENIRDEKYELKRKMGAINRQYISYTKNKLLGQIQLFGKRGVREAAQSKEPWNDYIRELYFEDIKYRSALRKIRDKISALETEYGNLLSQIKEYEPCIQTKRNNRLFF